MASNSGNCQVCVLSVIVTQNPPSGGADTQQSVGIGCSSSWPASAGLQSLPEWRGGRQRQGEQRRGSFCFHQCQWAVSLWRLLKDKRLYASSMSLPETWKLLNKIFLFLSFTSLDMSYFEVSLQNRMKLLALWWFWCVVISDWRFGETSVVNLWAEIISGLLLVCCIFYNLLIWKVEL